MKLLYFTFFAVFLVEIHGQRARTNNQAAFTTAEPKTIRSRGRARFSNPDEVAHIDQPSRPSSTNIRASAKARTDTSTPTAVLNRRIRPTETPRGEYAVEELNNDSPIDSYLRQSRPRVLTESRSEPETLNFRRASLFEPSISGMPLEPVDKLGFGETARAIVQARGGELPQKTTTPVVDEQYLLSNFGNTIRTLASASREMTPQRIREDIPIQRTTSLRAEVPILNEADITSRRNIERGDPLPSLKGSDINVASTAGSRIGSRTRTSARGEVERVPGTTTTTTERLIVEDFRRIDSSQDDIPETVEELSNIKMIMTELPELEIITEPLRIENEEELSRNSGVEIFTAKSSTTLPPPKINKQTLSRRGGSRRESSEEVEYVPVSRTRSRPRIKVPDEPRQTSRARISRRRYDEVEAAESRRGPSVFTAEVETSRTRTGRRIEDSPERYTVDLRELTTTRARSLNRRSTIASTESSQDKRSRGRSRLRTVESTPFTTTTRSGSRRQPKNEEPIQNRQRTSKATRFNDPKSSPTRDRSLEPAPQVKRSRGRSSLVDNKESKPSLARPDTRSRLNLRASTSKPFVEGTTSYYGERASKPESSEKVSPRPTSRSTSRLLDTDTKIDESKLEVMPLFERESKVIKSRGLRSRSSIDDHMHVSATENDVKFIDKPTSSAVTTKSVRKAKTAETSTTRIKSVSRDVIDDLTTVPVPTTIRSSSITTKVVRSLPVTESTTTLKVISSTPSVSRSKPVTKESVVQEVSQVTSKSTITRRKKVPKARTGEAVSRGSKKAELKNSDISKKKSSEEVNEEDNYPEPFKAKLKQQKEKQDQSIPSNSIFRNNGKTIKAFSPAPSSTTRSTTTFENSGGNRQEASKDTINEIENELDPKIKTTMTTSTARSYRSRQSKVTDKPSILEKKDAVSKSTGISRDTSTKSTLKPRRTYSTKAYSTRSSAERQSRRKALRSTALPPSTTPLSSLIKESKYSSKFAKKTTKDDNSLENPQPTGLYSSKKAEGEEKVAKKLDVSSIQNAKTVPPIKKFNSSRYSARYRGDTTTRASVLRSTTTAPFYIPTIPTPAYVPTVPTVTPPLTAVDDGIVAVKDADLGVEVISFDDPVNSTPSSADLVNGEYLTTDKNLKFATMVKGGTTEKPVSIIERIINSITQISTTAAPDTSTSIPATGDQGNSAILKLTNKKTTTKDKTDVQTNTIETITSEKPTTIIEKIRSSLSEIQTKEVGTSPDDNIVSSSSTTPLSTVTKYSAKYRGSSLDSTSLPAPLPLSTSVSPLSVFDELDKNQVLEKRAIGKLLDILNGLVSTESTQGRAGELVVVTPKTSMSTAGEFVSTMFTPQEPLQGISLDGIETTSSSDIDFSENLTIFTPTSTDFSSSPLPNTNTNDSMTSTSETSAETSSNSLKITNSDVTADTETSTPPMQNTKTPTTITPDNTATTDIPTTTTQVVSTTFFPSAFEIESSRMARLLEKEKTSSTSGATTTSTTTIKSNLSVSTENTTSMPTTSIESTLPISSSTTPLQPSTTMPTNTDTTVAITMQTSESTLAPKSLEIMAVPGETRISKSQTATTTSSTDESNSTSTEASTTSTSTARMNSTTSAVTGTLGLTEILNEKTVDAFNNLVKSDVNSSAQANNYKTSQVNKYNEVLNIQDLINRKNGNVVYRWKPVTQQEYKDIKKTLTTSTSSTSTTDASTETTAPLSSLLSNEIQDSTDRMQPSTTIIAPTASEIKTPMISTTTTTSMPITTTTTSTTTTETSTRRIETTTTSFSTFTPSTNLLRDVLTTKRTPLSSTRRSLDSAQLNNNIFDGRFEVLATAGTTAQPSSVAPPSSTARISTTTPPSTSITTTTEFTTQSNTSPILTMISGGVSTPSPSSKSETDKMFEDLKKSGKLKNLNEEQRKNLEEIEKIEKEQAELLRQLSVLTTLFGGPNGRAPNLPSLPPLPTLGRNGNSLANRVIAMAMERDASRTGKSSNPSTFITEAATKRPNSIQDQLPTTEVEDSTKKSTPSLEDVLKQYNIDVLSTPAPLTSTYGKTDEAVLAAILKEHGIGPTTPKDLGEKVKEAGLFEDVTTTKKPKPRPRTTTARPLGGGLMRGLTWLLDILEGPTTRKPTTRKSKPKTQTPKPTNQEEELLTNQPTRITPMVTEAPVTRPSLSQEEIKTLIGQLESVQKNPKTVEQLDFSKIKSLQHLIETNEGVQVSNSGQHGATSRGNVRPSELTFSQDTFLKEVNRKPKASTSTLSTSNSIDDDIVVSTTVRNRVLPPVSLNPIAGIDDPEGGSMIRSNLLTAAVNVTRAISGFLGSAIQGARRGFRSLLGSGSSMAGDIAHGSVG